MSILQGTYCRPSQSHLDLSPLGDWLLGSDEGIRVIEITEPDGSFSYTILADDMVDRERVAAADAAAEIERMAASIMAIASND